MISCTELHASHGSRPVLHGVDLRVAPGEVVGLLGPNGAGKTTTMRVLLGLHRPDAGTVAVDGPVGYLPEAPEGHDALRVEDQLRFLAEVKGLDRRSIDGAVGAALDEADVADLARRPVGRLSKGQRQRVGLAQALLGDPPTLLLDEPTSGLDPGQVRAVRTLVRSRAEAGAAVLVSTHLLAEAAATCDRVVVLARGRVVADEVPGEGDDLEDRFLRLVAEAELS